ncbi:MAG: beta-mannanase [Ruminococcaceae bacterium]|nr:beta-mannanase [Oscillospiraceae bacterium]
MKKFLSAAFAAVMMISVTSCSETSVDSTSVDGQTTTATSVPVTQEAAENITEPLSVPVAMVDGDINMEKAMSYQTDIDALLASFEAKTIDPTKPVSENSNEDTIAVFEFLRSIYGDQILTAQQMKNDDCLEDIAYYDNTGDMPAMKGFDFNNCTGSYISETMVDEAIEWHNESGGLVTFTWHWNVPRDIDDPDMGHAFYQEDIINWNQINAVTPGTKEYRQVIHDIDVIASKLQKLESAGVTVLFRPLHEASGSWFWWGVHNKSSVENQVFQKLWYIIFDRIENYHKLTNIIWVWNGQTKHCMVHPNSYDIAGIDYYGEANDHSSKLDQYNKLNSMNADSGKMLALTECGCIPDPDECKETGAMWLYYMLWNGEFLCETSGGGAILTNLSGTPRLNTERMTVEMLQSYFNSDNIVTYSDLPDRFTEGKEFPSKLKVWEYFKIE